VILLHGMLLKRWFNKTIVQSSWTVFPLFRTVYPYFGEQIVNAMLTSLGSRHAISPILSIRGDIRQYEVVSQAVASEGPSPNTFRHGIVSNHCVQSAIQTPLNENCVYRPLLQYFTLRLCTSGATGSWRKFNLMHS
jgi:hypothetical protein